MYVKFRQREWNVSIYMGAVLANKKEILQIENFFWVVTIN